MSDFFDLNKENNQIQSSINIEPNNPLLPLASENTSSETPQLEAIPTFDWKQNSGIFTVGENGTLTIDFLADGGS
jgi:hypothetical protein